MLYPNFLTAVSFLTLLINKYADPALAKRILVFNVSENPIIRYMNFMNSIFSLGPHCHLDVCQLYEKHSPFLEHAASLTKGIYVRALSSSTFYGFLSYYFLPEKGVRDEMIMPHDNIGSMKVPCSCHGKPIQNDTAFVCTVCLSILCQKTNKCPFHHLKSYVCQKHVSLLVFSFRFFF